MSALIRPGEVLDNRWIDIADDADLPPSGQVILSWARWLSLDGQIPTGDLQIGLRLPNTLDVVAHASQLQSHPLLVLDFPSFADGRAYSQARLLKARLGYRGELRAAGQAVVRDQLQSLQNCGFDSYQLRDDQDPALCIGAFADFSASYQPNLLAMRKRLRPGSHAPLAQ